MHAVPESYLQFVSDFDRLRKLANYLALGVFSNPPQLSDLKGFSFDNDDVQALKSCKTGGLSDSDASRLHRRASSGKRR